MCIYIYGGQIIPMRQARMENDQMLADSSKLCLYDRANLNQVRLIAYAVGLKIVADFRHLFLC